MDTLIRTFGPCDLPYEKFTDQHGEYVVLKSAQFLMTPIHLPTSQTVVIYTDGSINQIQIEAGHYTLNEILYMIGVIGLVTPDLSDGQCSVIKIHVHETVDIGVHLADAWKCESLLQPGYHFISGKLLPKTEFWSCFAVVGEKEHYLRSFPVFAGDEICSFKTKENPAYWESQPCKVYLPEGVSKFTIEARKSNTKTVQCRMSLHFVTP